MRADILEDLAERLKKALPQDLAEELAEELDGASANVVCRLLERAVADTTRARGSGLTDETES